MEETVRPGRLHDTAKMVLRPIFKFLWRFEVSGAEHVPKSGRAIIAPNHISVIDSFAVPAVLPRRITYVGKVEYLDDWKTRRLFPALGMIALDRSGGESSKGALDVAAELLEADELFGIYPEGTRARDGRLHRGHTGPARLAFQTGAPIVPVGIEGTDFIQPPDTPIPRPFMSARIAFGEPVDPGDYIGKADDRVACRWMIDDVMSAIAGLSGRQYVPTFA
jgi:1-acyl-sn-glycerol-3-phosphate acyltransferase